MKLKCEFVLSSIADEVVAVPVGDNAQNYQLVLKLNEESGRIIELLNNETTLEEIVREIKKEYLVDDTQVEHEIMDFIEQLKTAGLIDE